MKLPTETYLISPALEEAILLAEVTSRPLLLKGEPGTGKSLLAEYLADRKKLPLYTWHIKSITQAKEGLYFLRRGFPVERLSFFGRLRKSKEHRKLHPTRRAWRSV